MNLGEVCPGTYQRRYYRLQSDGTDSSGNGGTLSNLNLVSFTNQGRFGGGADFGSVAATKALHTTTYPFSASLPDFVSVGAWIKLNDTADVALRRIFDINATGTTTGMRLLGGYRIASGDLIFQGFLQGSPNKTVEINVGSANINDWNYVLIRKTFFSSEHGVAINVNISNTVFSDATTPGCQLNPTYRLVVGNGTNTTAVQVLAIIDEVQIYAADVITSINPQRQYYTQAKGRFCI